jgi:hypothetical protein
MKTDSLKLFDMMWADSEITSCHPLNRAWGDEEIYLDYWGCYDQVFDAHPGGSISSRDLQPGEEVETFLLLRAEHVDQIIKSLQSHSEELRIMSKEQLATLEKWKSLSYANHHYMVAYIFNREAEANVKPQPDERTKEIIRLKVETSKLHFVLVGLLGLFFIPVSLLLLIDAVSKGFKIGFLAVGFASLVLYGVVVWLVRRGHVMTVKYFSDKGVVRNDGRSLAWADLSRVVDQIRFDRVRNFKGIWRTEIQFKNGESAWLIPVKISNFREVNEFVRNLPCEHTEVRV